ncbi:transglycosylase domain-containing protein [Streptomyces fuscigenes]|uniref:transglycosylase domain-containing protein n=1 Tax=Streptomyces fuscigenes TaxID=1528880 RepID=UPI001F406C26|nr:transglycosylase domain-containing protein [Streptomyces fuscigenes]MCF3960407.1 penicillin-binding protein [Streptomyces fuscigenes]
MPKKRSGGGLSKTQQAAKFLGVSVLAGAVLAGIALPAVGSLGLAAKGTVKGFDELPANLKTPPLSQRTTILDADGGKIADVYSRDRTVVPLKDISPYMQRALVAIEDSRYYEHGAIDIKGVARALNKNAQSGGVSQGASTLTQQYVKNVFIEEAGDDPDKVAQATQQTMGRKVQELKYAIQVEDELGKKKILENYLNITFFGEQAYGVEAASERYFSKHAKDLDLDEAALLAGLVQSPSQYDPINDEPTALKRRNTVLARMAQLGDISQSEADKAMKTPIKLKVTHPKSGCTTAVKGAGFFCDYVRDALLNDPSFGKTAEDRAKRWNTGGLTIKTTLDPKAQGSVQNAIENHVYKSDSVATAVTLVQPGTGKIVAMGQSRPYGLGKNETQINLSVNHDMGGGTGFQSGSTFKPITAAAAIDGGTDPGKVEAAPNKMNYPSPVQTCDKTWQNSTTDPATVENESKSEVGPMNMKEAMAKSVNTYFVQLISQIGVCPVTKMATQMGVQRADGKKLDQVPSLTLGTQLVSPLTMANAYATFANKGVYCSPVAVLSITDTHGKSLPVPKSECKQAMSEHTATVLNSLLKGVVEDGTGTLAGLTDRDSAGKTGTTDDINAAWFVGYTSDMAGAVWVGGPSGNVSMRNITIGGQYHQQVMGADTPGPIWKAAMSGALAGTTSPPLPTINLPDMKKKDPKPPKGDHGGKPGGGDDGNNGDTAGADAGAANGGAGQDGGTGTPPGTGQNGGAGNNGGGNGDNGGFNFFGGGNGH